MGLDCAGYSPLMQASDTQQKIDTLTACGPLKAWSVIVTILGDLCQDQNDRVSGRSLTRIMGAMGISAQTVRVALHRLRRDGPPTALVNFDIRQTTAPEDVRWLNHFNIEESPWIHELVIREVLNACPNRLSTAEEALAGQAGQNIPVSRQAPSPVVPAAHFETEQNR